MLHLLFKLYVTFDITAKSVIGVSVMGAYDPGSRRALKPQSNPIHYLSAAHEQKQTANPAFSPHGLLPSLDPSLPGPVSHPLPSPLLLPCLSCLFPSLSVPSPHSLPAAGRRDLSQPVGSRAHLVITPLPPSTSLPSPSPLRPRCAAVHS